jgi:hypothetical protein
MDSFCRATKRNDEGKLERKKQEGEEFLYGSTNSRRLLRRRRQLIVAGETTLKRCVSTISERKKHGSQGSNFAILQWQVSQDLFNFLFSLSVCSGTYGLVYKY